MVSDLKDESFGHHLLHVQHPQICRVSVLRAAGDYYVFITALVKVGRIDEYSSVSATCGTIVFI
jgi:hypothetical protein